MHGENYTKTQHTLFTFCFEVDASCFIHSACVRVLTSTISKSLKIMQRMSMAGIKIFFPVTPPMQGWGLHTPVKVCANG